METCVSFGVTHFVENVISSEFIYQLLSFTAICDCYYDIC